MLNEAHNNLFMTHYLGNNNLIKLKMVNILMSVNFINYLNGSKGKLFNDYDSNGQLCFNFYLDPACPYFKNTI